MASSTHSGESLTELVTPVVGRALAIAQPQCTRIPGKQLPSPADRALPKSGKRAPSRKEREVAQLKEHYPLAAVGREINSVQIPDDAINFIATFLVHATLPYKDPGDVRLWERSSGPVSVTFEAGHAPKDNDDIRRPVGLPFGIYPRLIFSWVTTEAVRTRKPQLSLGRSFTDWIRDGLHISPTGGEKGTITRVREQMTRMLAMKTLCDRLTAQGRLAKTDAGYHLARG